MIAGYSPAHKEGEYDGLELQTINWHVDPLIVANVKSSFFEELEAFPAGTVEFDNAPRVHMLLG